MPLEQQLRLLVGHLGGVSFELVAAPATLAAPPPPFDAGVIERPTQIIALATWTPVRVEARREAQALGYLRAGATVDVLDGPVGRDGCVVHRDHPEGGWYHVRGGGFVCVGGNFAARATVGIGPVGDGILLEMMFTAVK